MVTKLFDFGKGKRTRDPVCGMEVDERQAAARIDYQGQTYSFCCPHCKAEFESNPAEYIHSSER